MVNAGRQPEGRVAKKRSPIEDLFEEVYGYRPQKEGAAYEMLAAVVSKLLGFSSDVLHERAYS